MIDYLDTSLAKLFKTIDFSALKKSVKNKGFFQIGNINDDAFCKEICDEIDQLATDVKTESNFGNTEQRVWEAHKKSKFINLFFSFSNQIISKVKNMDTVAYDTLAIKNEGLVDKNEKNIQNRWHRDSAKVQLKVFLFLTSVSEENGPLQFVTGTHTLGAKWECFKSGKLITLSDIFESSGSRRYEALSDQYINNIINSGYNLKSFLVSAGTCLIVDTSGLHRAKPCYQNSRYALTSYYS
tara:strand:+ start:532 stop:1251 length:720 start_codon:yes stop_codon:yes gene_type:complete